MNLRTAAGVGLATLAACSSGGRAQISGPPAPTATTAPPASGQDATQPPVSLEVPPEETTTVVQSPAPALTTEAASSPVVVLPEDTDAEQTDGSWWASQPGYDGSMPLPPQWVSDRESGGDYAAVNAGGCGGRGCYGRWQFDPVTSDAVAASMGRSDLVGTSADQWSPADQDEAAAALWVDGDGCAAWAAC